MLIELQEPFRPLWQKGYLREEPDGRKYLSLYNSPGNQTSISYARYLMCVHLGYLLSPDLEVDHRNDDKTDDRIDNLQVLTKEQNLAKEHQRRFEEGVLYGCYCAYCNLPFLITPGERNKRLKESKSGLAFCCHEHSRLYFPPPGKNVLDQDTKDRIASMHSQDLSSYQISSQLGVSRNTVMKYW
jgi:hypothetical protein